MPKSPGCATVRAIASAAAVSLDELLQGTFERPTHHRRTGVLRALIERGAIGW